MGLCTELSTVLKNSGCAQCCCRATYLVTNEEVVLHVDVVGESLLSLYAYIPSLKNSVTFDNFSSSCEDDLPFKIIGPINCISC